MEKILITGMEGMVGTHLARIASSREYRVAGTYFPELYPRYLRDRIDSGMVTAISCDLTQKHAVDKLVATQEPDVIIHLAGQSNNAKSWEDTTFQDNTAMLGNLLQAVVKTGFRTRIVLASTVNVYGSANFEVLLNEEDELNPQTPYALSKWAQEELLRIYHARYPDLEFNIARMAQHTGPGRSSGMVETEIGEQILGIEQGLPPVIMVRNLLAEVALFDVMDACDAYFTLAATESSGGVYNVAPHKGHTVREIAEIMVGVSQIATKGGVTLKSSGEEQFVPSRFDTAKIQELGWSPKIPLDYTLRDLLSWMRNGTHLST